MKYFIPATEIETKLQVVSIFFNTALFDEIERDKDGKMPIRVDRRSMTCRKKNSTSVLCPLRGTQERLQ